MKRSFNILLASLLASVSVYSLAGGESCQFEPVATCSGFIEGITVSPSGDIWLVDVSTGSLLSIEDGQCIEKANTGSIVNGAKFLANGNLAIADHSGLLEYNLKTQKFSVLADTFNGEPLQRLNDLSVDSQGGIYFTVMGFSSIQNPSGKVFYLPPNSKEPQLIADNIAFPNGIALHPNENSVAVAEFAAKRILSLPSATVKAGGPPPLAYVWAYTEGGVGPDGILYDKDGNLYVANLGSGEVFVYSPIGKLLGALALPDSAASLVTNLAFTKDKLYVTESGKNQIWAIDYPVLGCLK